MRIVAGAERYAVVSCHVERPLDDRVWAAFERLLRRRPGGFVVTPMMRPPDPDAGEDESRWLERARIAASLAPLGQHTHWGGPTQARPTGGPEPAALVRRQAEWLRERGLAPRFFCGGGWYIDEGVAETLASFGYVDCSATTFRQSYLDDSAPRLGLDGPVRLRLPSGASLVELPATHSLGMLARGHLRLPDQVHVHFHDWELVDRKRAAALEVLFRLLRARRRRLTVAELAERVATEPEQAWPGVTIAGS
jgi:hypothetical protein